MGYQEYFKGKKITVMGLGVLGRGVGDVAFLAKQGADIIVTDLKDKEALKRSVAKLKRYRNVKFSLGKHRLGDFRGRNLVLKGAGVPLDSLYIREAKKHGIPVKMSTALFAKISGLPIIGVTGTRGKSTVAHLIHHILKTAGKRVLLGGNIAGVSTLSLLPKARNCDYAVLELDSWQLQGFGTQRCSPHMAVFTTFYPDHLNYYKGNLRRYFMDKALLYSHQRKSDILVAGAQALPYIRKYSRVPGKLLVPFPKLPFGWKIAIPGAHNEYNASLAIAAARSLGIADRHIKNALATFPGVPGRLEHVRLMRGIEFYNDTTATTPEATIAALKALGKNKNIVLIMGGSDKGLDTRELSKEISRYTKKLVLLAGSGTATLPFRQKPFSNMRSAVREAMNLTKRGDVVLLSPAFASFGMFANEYDRGIQFVKQVKKLK